MARHTSPGRRRWALAALAVILSAPAASAQTRLYMLFAGDMPLCAPTNCEPSRVLDIDVEGRRVLADTPVLFGRQNASPPVVTPDGRYLAWIGTENRVATPSYLSAFDTAARRQMPLVRTSAGGYAGAVMADPTAVRLFTQFETGSPLTIAEPQGFRGLPVPCANGLLQGISGDGSRLFVMCQSSIPSEVVVMDAATGVTVGRVPAFGIYPSGMHLAPNDNGTELYFAAWVSSSAVSLRRIDVATGATLAERAVTLPYSEIAFDRRTHRVYLNVADPATGGTVLEVYNGDTLALIGGVPSPVSRPASAVVVPDPERDFVYLAWYLPSTTSNGWRTALALLETTTWNIVEQAELANDTYLVGMVLGPRPPRATGLSASVTGSTVTLAWTNAASRTIATGLVVEAGSAPGQSDLAALPVAAEQVILTVPRVPRGTYFVRVRALNGTGPGEPSNEVVVAVP